MLSIFMAVTVDVSIFSINSLQSMSFSNPAFLLPLSLLCVASIFFVGLTIKQFYDDDKEPSKNIGDFNPNGIGGFSPA